MRSRICSFRRPQGGAALVVALIMLVMVSLLAAASFMMATTEARGAAGWSDRQRAMFSAEGALKEAEAAVKALAAKDDVLGAVSAKSNGYYVRHHQTKVVPDVSVASNWVTANAVQATAVDTNVTEVFYMVVYEGTAPQGGGSGFVTGTGGVAKTSVRPRFTLYAKSGGLKDGTFVVLSTSKEF